MKVYQGEHLHVSLKPFLDKMLVSLIRFIWPLGKNKRNFKIQLKNFFKVFYKNYED